MKKEIIAILLQGKVKTIVNISSQIEIKMMFFAQLIYILSRSLILQETLNGNIFQTFSILLMKLNLHLLNYNFVLYNVNVSYLFDQ